MGTAYSQARLAGFSRLASIRVALLVARLARRDPATDTWGRRIEKQGERLPATPDRRQPGLR